MNPEVNQEDPPSALTWDLTWDIREVYGPPRWVLRSLVAGAIKDLTYQMPSLRDS